MGAQTLIAVDADSLDALRAEVRQLREMLAGATIIPAPQWLPVGEAAKALGRDRTTINRWIALGRLEAKDTGGRRLVKVPHDARR